MRRFVSALALLFIVVSLSVIVSRMDVARAFMEGPVFIRPNGGVDPSDAPIQQIGELYVLTSNITSSLDHDGIVVERDNVVLDGAGYTVRSDGNGTGIDLYMRRNVTIKNTIVTGFGYGISVTHSSNVSILKNNISYVVAYAYSPGIYFYNCSDSTISGNFIKGNHYGIWLADFSNNSLIVENEIANNWCGMRVDGSFGNPIYHNNFLKDTEMPSHVQIHDNSANSWDDDYPSGGNWWSEYYGIDGNGDDIGDMNYTIDNNNTDRYPLMNPWGSVYIKADGSISPLSAPIQKNGDVYTLTNDIYCPVIVRKDNLTLDGAGHKIQGREGIAYSRGLDLSGRKNVTAKNLNIKGFAHEGILLDNSIGNKILRNNITGITGHYAYSPGIWFFNSCSNIISQNNVTNNNAGFRLDNSSGNFIIANNLANNWINMEIGYSSDNYIHHNNFRKYEFLTQISSFQSTNLWYYGYPTEGNYWSDYTGADINGDGIGEDPYTIDQNNTDRYPLVGPLTAFDAGTWDDIPYDVTVSSNSTLSGFQFNPNGAVITFSVSGPDGSVGFCRVTIPKELLWVSAPPTFHVSSDQWQVLVGDVPVVFTLDQDAENTYFSFNYTHSTKTVQIIGTNAIPEFQSFIVPAFMLATLMALAICKRKRPDFSRE